MHALVNSFNFFSLLMRINFSTSDCFILACPGVGMILKFSVNVWSMLLRYFFALKIFTGAFLLVSMIIKVVRAQLSGLKTSTLSWLNWLSSFLAICQIVEVLLALFDVVNSSVLSAVSWPDVSVYTPRIFLSLLKLHLLDLRVLLTFSRSFCCDSPCSRLKASYTAPH